MADRRLPDWVFPQDEGGPTLLPVGGAGDGVDEGLSAWDRRVAPARRLLAVGEGAGAIAQVVSRPGMKMLGRRYRRDGSNRLGGLIRTSDELRQVAMHQPLTVVPSYAYVIVDVDYGVSADAVGCEAMARRVGEFCDRVWSTGIDVVRIGSGGFCDREVEVGPDGPLEEPALQAGPFGRMEPVPGEGLVDTPPVSHGEVVDVRVDDDGRTFEVRRYHHEHLWIVTGWHTQQPKPRRWVSEKLHTVLPGCELKGGAVFGNFHAQQIRPPGSRHRHHGTPDGFDYADTFTRLAAIDPPRTCFRAFAMVLATMHQQVLDVARSRVQLHTMPRDDDELDGWAVDYLTNGIPDTDDRSRWYPDSDGVPTLADATRSAQFARLVGHMIVNRWELAAIIDRLVDSPASAHLTERQGNATLLRRVSDDVERIATKHRSRKRPHAPLVVHQVAAAWPDMTLPDGTTSKWLTDSGRMVMVALCRHAVRTGYLALQTQQRTIAVEAAVSLPATHRALHRWIALGALIGVYNDLGELVGVELVSEVLARLLPDRVTGTEEVHAPPSTPDLLDLELLDRELDELLRRHDGWLARPAGAFNISVPLGRGAQAVAGWLALHGGGTIEEIAEARQVTTGHVAETLARLRYHLIAWSDDGVWRVQTDVDVLEALLDHAAQLQNTAGLLAERCARYDDDIQAWRRGNDIAGVIQEEVDDLIDEMVQWHTDKQPRAPGLDGRVDQQEMIAA